MKSTLWSRPSQYLIMKYSFSEQNLINTCLGGVLTHIRLSGCFGYLRSSQIRCYKGGKSRIIIT